MRKKKTADLPATEAPKAPKMIEPAAPFAGRTEKTRIPIDNVQLHKAIPGLSSSAFISFKTCALEELEYIPADHVIRFKLRGKQEQWLPISNAAVWSRR